MTRDEIKRLITHQLSEIAPEADLEAIDPRQPYREQLDIDSMDFLNFVTGLYRVLGVEIPETDYARVDTLERLVDYLADRCGKGEPSSRMKCRQERPGSS